MAGLFNAVVSAGKFVKDKLKVISSFKYVFRGVSKRLPKTGGAIRKVVIGWVTCCGPNQDRNPRA